MDIAVSDSDVLIHIAKLNLLNLLKGQFSKIFISEIVYNECVTQGISSKKADAYILKDFLKLELFQIEKVKKKVFEEYKSKYKIHEGESSIIALALKFDANFCLSNEIKVRNAIKSEGLKAVGTLGIILKGYNLNQINKKQCLKILNNIKKRSSEFRFHRKIIETIITTISVKKEKS